MEEMNFEWVAAFAQAVALFRKTLIENGMPDDCVVEQLTLDFAKSVLEEAASYRSQAMPFMESRRQDRWMANAVPDFLKQTSRGF